MLFLGSQPLTLRLFLSLLLRRSLGFEEKGFGEDIPVRAECSSLSHTAQGCVSHHLLQEEASPMRVEQRSDLSRSWYDSCLI